MNVGGRIAIVLLCVTLLFGMGIHYDTTEFRDGPDSSDVMDDPAAYDGEAVLWFVEEEEIASAGDEIELLLTEEPIVDIGLDGIEEEIQDTHQITVYADNPVTLADVDTDSTIQIHGTIQDDGTAIKADEVVIDYADGGDFTYVMGSSLLGLLLALGYFFRYWTIDIRGLAFVPRGGRDG